MTVPAVVLFDLDGTLSDSAPGILGALRLAFAENGLPPLDAATEQQLLGPPFYESLPPIIGADRVDAVIAAYRAHYAQSKYDTTLFPGVRELLAALHRDGRRLAVATSKPEHYAVPIVEYLGIAGCFETIGGDDLYGSLRTKALVIGSVLDRLGRPEVATVMMVGDRSHDIAGAREHGVDCIAVSWGYGSMAELVAAGPAEIAATPADAGEFLGVRVDARTQ